MSRDPECIFCKIIAGEIPSFKIYEDDSAFAFLDINPITPGHTLVIPKNHHENLFEIPQEDLEAVQRASQKVARMLKVALNPGGIAVLQLNGRGANQVVMHYHVHLVPRNRPEDGVTILEWELTPGDMDEVAKVADQIAAVG